MSGSSETPRNRVFAVLLTGVFISLLCVTIINLALPSIQRGLGASDTELQWVLSGYTLTYGVLLIPAGRLGDIFGHGRLFMIGIGLFTLASLLGSIATSPLMLILSRVVMGVGAGLFNPQVLGLIQRLYAGAERAAAFAAFGAVTAVGAAVGPMIGGALLTWVPGDLGWRSTFAINVPFGLLTLLLAWRTLPRNSPSGATPVSRDLDPAGVLILGAATVSLMLPFMGGPWWLLVPALILALGFVAWERHHAARGRSPMVDLSLFSYRSFSVGTAVFTLYYMGIISIYVIQTLLIQDGLGGSAMLAGLVSVPPALMTAVGSWLAARWVVRHGWHTVMLGLLVSAAGLVLTIAAVYPIVAGASVWWNAVTLSVATFGMGFTTSALQTLALDDVPVASAGTTGGILQTGQRIGTAIGLAIIPGIWFQTTHLGWATAHAISYGAILGFTLLAVVVAEIQRPRRPAPATRAA